MIPCQRHLFEIPGDVAYLNCAYMSPLARPVAEAGMQAIGRKLAPWTVKPEDFFTESEAARSLFDGWSALRRTTSRSCPRRATASPSPRAIFA